MKVLFVEPPKQFWFVMGEYLPPPLGILHLAAYLEMKEPDVEIEVVDCQAEYMDWHGLEKRIESFAPDMVAPSGLATCNAYLVARTAAVAKKVDPAVFTVAGGQHFTATAQESLEAYPEIDAVVRGEGEATLLELVSAVRDKLPLSEVRGISFRESQTIRHTPPRPLFKNLDDLPFPAYHFVEEHMKKYHFTMMAGPTTGYALVEGSRGCQHRCAFCTQWRHWQGTWRSKSAKRIADEFEYCYRNYGSKFLWLTDDNFSVSLGGALSDEILQRGLGDDISWFIQVRCDEVVKHQRLIPKMRRAGLRWALLGVESLSPKTLQVFRKDADPKDAHTAVDVLKKNDVFAQAMFIIGERNDTSESIAYVREFANQLNPDLVIFMVLTPLPGTELHEEAQRRGWIEDTNWANYDMVHAVMPTETLTREEIQEELYRCYRSYYGSTRRRLTGFFSPNELKRRTYRYLAKQSLLRQLRSLF